MDTHLLLWAATGSDRLPGAVADALRDPGFRPAFSVASLWEVVIKAGLGRADFTVDAAALRRGLVAGGYEELAVEAPHVLGVGRLPPRHADPFDRLLLAQARAEGLPLWTVDAAVAGYGAPAEAVG
ncbi:type II toxin-antitoxin system VapC family toxin [Jannaschia sp. Os4]|uniref:type II toxin-antitoxin system VapC family toxin n=1 Tax=Jannaschia sp. Os4 TaxID=2807617 RepID=UPI001EEF2975|nr:type II toxin-antitoxin system VapC family toxin [Jannaschia sp. Os4]